MAKVYLERLPDGVQYKDVDGFPGYKVGDDGSVWSCLKTRWRGTGRGVCSFLSDQWHKISPVVVGRGYYAVNLCLSGKCVRRYIHEIVLTHFVGPRPLSMEACHGDRNKLNNAIGNLRWGTTDDNEADKVRHGTRHRGESVVQSKLTENDVVMIVKMAAADLWNENEIAAEFGITRGAVRSILYGNGWRHITQELSIRNPEYLYGYRLLRWGSILRQDNARKIYLEKIRNASALGSCQDN